MIDRLAVVSDLKRIVSYLHLDQDNLSIPPVIDPNICIGDVAPVLVPGQNKHIQLYKWGINGVAFVRAEGDRNKDNSQNYRGMMAIVNGTYRHQMLHQRCAVICDAFIVNAATAYPYLIYPRDKKRPFLLPAIWEERNGVRSFAIIDIWANQLFRHFEMIRCPIIITDKKEIRSWLDPAHVSLGVSQLLKPWDYTLFNTYPIARWVNDPQCKDLGALQPIGPKMFEERAEAQARRDRELAIERTFKKSVESHRQDLAHTAHLKKLRDQGLIP